MARKFQGYARGRGFSARNAGSAAVSRIQEQGNKITSGLKGQLSRKRAMDQQYVSDLDSNFRRGQAIQDEIKRFDDKAFNLKQQNIRQNQETALENIRTEGLNQARAYEQLATFSETLGKTVVDVKNAIDDAQQKAQYANSIFNFDKFNNAPTAADKEGEDQLFKANSIAEASAQQSVTQDGLPQVIAQAQRSESPYRKLKNIDARIAALGDAYRARATYDNNGIGLLHDLLEEFGLQGVRQSRFYEVAQEIAKIQSGFESTNNKRTAIDLSTNTLNEVTAQFLNDRSDDNARNLIQTLRNHTEDGLGTIGLTKANDIFFQTLKNPAVSNADRERIMDLQMLDGNGEPTGRTYREQFKDTRYVTLLNEVENERIERVTQANNVIKAEQLDNYNKAREEIYKLGAEGEIDYDTYKSALDDLDVSKDQRTKLLEDLYMISEDKTNNDPLIKEADYLIDTGRDPTAVIMRMTGKPRAQYIDKLYKIQKVFQESGIDDKANKKRIYNAGKIRLGISNVGTVNDPSLDFATDDRLAKMQARRAELMRTESMNLATANNRAMAEMIDLIQSSELPEYKPQGTGTGNTRNIPDSSRTGVMGRGTRRKSTSNYYAYYSPGGTYFENVVQANKHQALQAVRARPDSRKDVFLVPTTSLAGIYDGIVGKKPYELPDTLKELQKAYPDTVQLQIDKYAEEFGLPKITVPLTFQQVLSQEQNDRRAQRFMQQIDTIQEERIIPIVADPSARSDSRFRTDVVNQRRLIMEIPAVEGGIQGLTVQDYDELAYIASAEAGPGDDPYLVAGTALNRLASGKYGKSLYDIARAEGQYEAVYTGKAYYDPARAKEFASPAGQRKLRGILELLNGRTDFKGQAMIHNRHESDIMVHPQGNFASYAGETPNSGAYTGPIDSSFRRFFN